MPEAVRIVAFAASNRRGSLNRLLLDRAVAAATEQGAEVDVIDLRRHPLPLYDADVQARDGIPHAAEVLVERIAAADAVLIATPEYNGGYPALFKNTLDWVSRIDMLLFQPRLVGLLSTTPGRGGGRRVIEHTRSLFEGMAVPVHAEGFPLPKGNEALTDDGWADPDAAAALDAWVAGFVEAAHDHLRQRDAA